MGESPFPDSVADRDLFGAGSFQDSKTAAHKGQLQALNLYKYTGTEHIIFPTGIRWILCFVYRGLVQHGQI